MNNPASIVCILLLFTSFLQGQTPMQVIDKVTPFTLGVVEQITSTHLSETRTLNIYLPQAYHPDSSTTFPIIYLLDGSANEDFVHIVGLVQFMNMYNLMPQSIVVGIANVDRYRDFTHTTNEKEDLESLPTGGGSELFIRFLESELQPYIERHYLSNGHKTIIGQSMGGLLATEVLLTKPQLFDDYIIVSPSLWWDNQSLVHSAGAFFKTHTDLKKKIFVALGKEHEVMHEVADKLVDAIEAAETPDITLFYETLLEEDHATILHRAVYQAFEKINKADEEK